MRTRLVALAVSATVLGLLTGCAGTPVSRSSIGMAPPIPTASPGSQGAAGAHGAGSTMGGAGSDSAGVTGRATPTASPAAAAPAGVTQVDIREFSFQPANIQVKVGTTVMWTNRDTTPHTITFRDDGMRGSDLLQQGQTFNYTFTTAGTYPYYCAPHTYMMGTVTATS